jgi:hypothetical protein
MKKISKAVTKKFSKKAKFADNLFTQDVISINDKKNKKYLDNFIYQEYLKTLNNKSSDSNEE